MSIEELKKEKLEQMKNSVYFNEKEDILKEAIDTAYKLGREEGKEIGFEDCYNQQHSRIMKLCNDLIDEYEAHDDWEPLKQNYMKMAIDDVIIHFNFAPIKNCDEAKTYRQGVKEERERIIGVINEEKKKLIASPVTTSSQTKWQMLEWLKSKLLTPAPEKEGKKDESEYTLGVFVHSNSETKKFLETEILNMTKLKEGKEFPICMLPKIKEWIDAYEWEEEHFEKYCFVKMRFGGDYREDGLDICYEVLDVRIDTKNPSPAEKETEYCEWREYTDEQGQYYLTECHKNRAVMPFYKIPENNKCLCGKPIKVKEAADE